MALSYGRVLCGVNTDVNQGGTVPRTTDHYISIQSIEPEQWDNIKAFLQGHKMMGKSALGRKAIENYIRLAGKYGIDANWDIKDPGGVHEQKEER
jgi:hypothetical protein